jgi:pimeloyl-ACP methyl ester carboxylesterase
VNPEAYAAEFVARIRQATVTTLAGGHMLHLESADAVAAAAASFFQ